MSPVAGTPAENQPPSRKRTGRVLKTVLSLLGIICIVLLAAALYLLGTSNGLKQLVSVSKHWIPGSLQISQINGSLLRDLNLQQVTYEDQNINISVVGLSFDWQPSALFSGKLHIVQLHIDQPVIDLKEVTGDAPEPPSSDPILSDIPLPLQLQIDQLKITQLTLNPPAATDNSDAGTHISAMTLSLHSDSDTLVLDQLTVEAPQAQLKMKGELRPSDNFPLRFTTEWSVSPAELPPLRGEGEIRGTLKGDHNGLSVQQTLSGLVSTELSASLQNLLASPQGQLRLTAINADLGIFAPGLAGSLMSGKASAEGGIDQVKLLSELQTNLPEIGETELSVQLHYADNILHIDQLVVHQLPADHSQRSTLSVKGAVNVASTPLHFDITGQWNNLGYPLTGKADYLSPVGQFKIQGNLQQYNLLLDSTITGNSIPAGTWRLTGTGNDQELRDILLTGKTLQGAVSLRGKLNWLPHLSWNLKASGQHLNPGTHWPEWPGLLDFNAAVEGQQLSDNTYHLQLSLASLSGVLRDEPVSARGRINLNDAQLEIAALNLNLATTEIRATGLIDEHLDLTWAINSPDLNQLLPVKGALLTVRGL